MVGAYQLSKGNTNMTNRSVERGEEDCAQSSGDDGLDQVDFKGGEVGLEASTLMLQVEERLKLVTGKWNLPGSSCGSSTSLEIQVAESEDELVTDESDSGSEVEYAVEENDGNHFSMDDSDGDDDARAYFPCPFCYVEIEIQVLCIHLQDEHCFDLKNAVCPLCAANLGKDATGHFIVQHSSSLKRRRKYLKSGHWNGTSAMLGKELNSFLGSPANGKANPHESMPDPLLSPFLSGISITDPKERQEDESLKKNVSVTSVSQSPGISSLSAGNELDQEERRQKAAFVQDLIASMIL
ncbi:hypothetical protein Tsubulata_016777 [Turnera subulata]|uniref:Drought induced 19 protein type zinc-binding domain-containing protein n=1 Tax=Turnera subulata TaxID=218843 RepID=A0A9Q0J403_9ROSI|nr:hypothetical protein Tsubulata_016777 [Turnera subulata]